MNFKVWNSFRPISTTKLTNIDRSSQKWTVLGEKISDWGFKWTVLTTEMTVMYSTWRPKWPPTLFQMTILFSSRSFTLVSRWSLHRPISGLSILTPGLFGQFTKIPIQICTFLYVVSVAKAFHHFVLHPEEHVDTEINSNYQDFNEDEFPDDMEHVHEHNDEAEDFLNVLNYLVS